MHGKLLKFNLLYHWLLGNTFFLCCSDCSLREREELIWNLYIWIQIILKSFENQLWLIQIVALKLITLFPHELSFPRNFPRQTWQVVFLLPSCKRPIKLDTYFFSFFISLVRITHNLNRHFVSNYGYHLLTLNMCVCVCVSCGFSQWKFKSEFLFA